MFARRYLLTLVAAIAWVVGSAAMCGAAIDPWLTAVGYQQLLDVRGGATPMGAGVAISQVEGVDVNGNYFADQLSTEYIGIFDPLGQAVQFHDGSGAGTGISNHASFVGWHIYGNSLGLARAATDVTLYDANRWMPNQLHYSDPALAPAAQPFKVQNHSWIGTFNNASSDLSVLRRFDYVIETGDMTAVVGTNNNNGATPNFFPNPSVAHPSLLAHSYNAIVAGRTDAKHARGMTNAVYGAGRYRPDLVSAATSTSVATAQISGAAALLRGVVAGTDADRSEPIKAMLMAGATKSEFTGFVEPSTGVANPWNQLNTLPTDAGNTRPLDDIFGAGELNIYNSYLMTQGGQHAGSVTQPTAAVASFGWDYQDRKNDAGVGDIYYNFVVPTGSKAKELSIVLNWNVKVVDQDPSAGMFSPLEALQNLDLKFYDSSTSFLGTQLRKSDSLVDNVEHVYFGTDLGPGTYTLAVSGAANWDFGLAWRMPTLFDVEDADFDDDGFVNGSDLLAWQRNLGKLVGAVNAEGDANGDGAVDKADLDVIKFALANPPPPPMAIAAVAAIPEPTTLASAAAAALSLLALARRGRFPRSA